MNILLVDTDVVSFLFKGDSRAQRYASIVQGHNLPLVTNNAKDFQNISELQVLTVK